MLLGFAVGEGDPLAGLDCPVLQASIGAESEEIWRAGLRGLAPRDVAMSVALPELDGRIYTRALGFKALKHRDDALQADVMTSRPVASRVEFVARLAASWVRLRRVAAPSAALRYAVRRLLICSCSSASLNPCCRARRSSCSPTARNGRSPAASAGCSSRTSAPSGS